VRGALRIVRADQARRSEYRDADLLHVGAVGTHGVDVHVPVQVTILDQGGSGRGRETDNVGVTDSGGNVVENDDAAVRQAVQQPLAELLGRLPVQAHHLDLPDRPDRSDRRYLGQRLTAHTDHGEHRGVGRCQRPGRHAAQRAGPQRRDGSRVGHQQRLPGGVVEPGSQALDGGKPRGSVSRRDRDDLRCHAAALGGLSGHQQRPPAGKTDPGNRGNRPADPLYRRLLDRLDHVTDRHQRSDLATAEQHRP